MFVAKVSWQTLQDQHSHLQLKKKKREFGGKQSKVMDPGGMNKN